MLVYWSICLALLAVAGYIVILDIRYIRLQYTIGRRLVFRQTLGDERFRKELRTAQRKVQSIRNASGNNGRKQ